MSTCFEIANKNSVWNGFWDAQPELNQEAICPQPCKWADHCVYNGPGGCGFVHPGEQGTGRKLFQGRAADEKPSIRLIGRPTFYERRRLRLSWPQWCARAGLPAPVPLSKVSAEKKPVAQIPQTLHQLHPVHPAYMQQMMGMCMAMMANPLYFQQPLSQPQPQPQPQPPPRRREVIGNKLFSLIKDQLASSVEERAEAGLLHPNITPGKITGMLLEKDLDEAEALCKDTDLLGDMVIEACEVIIKAFP
jgi:hypothetical protein